MSVDLSIDICGVGLRNPFILSSATPTKTAKNIKKGIDSGWAGAVMKTLVPFDYARAYPRPRFKIYWLKDQGDYPNIIPRSLSITDIEEGSHLSPEDYTEELNKAKKLVGEDGLIIGSVTASDMETWEKYIDLMNSSKADMVELNFSCPYAGEPGSKEKGIKFGWSLMYMAEEVIKLAKKKSAIPFSTKISSQTGEVDKWAVEFEKAGTQCLTLSHRISTIDIDIETSKPIPFGCIIGFGGPYLVGFSLKWIVKSAMETEVPIMANMGMLEWSDVNFWISEVTKFMKKNGYNSLNEIKGSVLDHIISPSSVKRGNQGYYAIVDEQKCTGCGICKRTCFYFALEIHEGKAKVNLRNCDGCGLCREVCPEDAITVEKISDNDLHPRPDTKEWKEF
jgi:dihydropyrimidine dehydrogenase (NAD+) subunit PreA